MQSRDERVAALDATCSIVRGVEARAWSLTIVQVAAIKKVVEEGSELSLDERNLLSVGYKNVICESGYSMKLLM